MDFTTALILILGFIFAYILIIGIFSILFRATGLTKEKARYQSISLFTNCGFTTSESELITSNKRRRNIALTLMIIGHVFSVVIVSIIVSLLGDFKTSDVKNNINVIAIILGSFLCLIILIHLPFVKKPIGNLFDKILTNRVMKKDKKNLITILDNYGKQSLVEIYLYYLPRVLNDKSLQEAALKRRFDLNLVAVKRKNKVLNVTAETILQPFDKIIIFGNIATINELFLAKEEVTKMSFLGATKNKVSIIDNYGKDAMCEIEIHQVPDNLEDTPLFESNLKSKYNITVILVKHGTAHTLVGRDTIIKENDVIVVFGPYQNIKDIFRAASDTD